MKQSRAYIPDKSNIYSTSDVDGVNTAFGYWGPLSYPMRRRLDMAVQTLPKDKKYASILDAGYGCGIFLPELYRRLLPHGRLYGVDIHNGHQNVSRQLLPAEQMDGRRVFLSQASLDNLPFENSSFDLITSISVMEHIAPSRLASCFLELKRVAKPDADIIIGFPTDCLFIRALAWAQNQDLKKNHPSTHIDVLSAIKEAGFKVISSSGFPKFWGPLTMHYNVRLVF